MTAHKIARERRGTRRRLSKFCGLLVCVRQRNQGRFTEGAASKRHAEWCWIDDWSSRWRKSSGNYNARVARFRRRRCTAILWKEDRIEVIISALDSVRTIENCIESASCQRQVERTIREVSLRVCTARIRVELISCQKDRLSILQRHRSMRVIEGDDVTQGVNRRVRPRCQVVVKIMFLSIHQHGRTI